MTSTISALTTGGGGIVMSGDSSGNLSLLSGATTVVAVTSTGATVTGTLLASGTVGTSATGALTLPVGTTAQRPTPVTGMTRFNSTTGYLEYYNGTAWYAPTSFIDVKYLVVAGGGGGGNGAYSGGGGAGGLIQASIPTTIGVLYPVSIGAGGAASYRRWPWT